MLYSERFLFCSLCVQIAVSHDGQIQYLPVSSEQQIVNPEDLEAAAHSAVTGWLSEGADCSSLVLYSVLHHTVRLFIFAKFSEDYTNEMFPKVYHNNQGL